MARTTKKIVENIKRLAAKNRRLTEEKLDNEARAFLVVEVTRLSPYLRND